MHRYFLELAYKGTAYSGFQVQENANTIQSETERALEIFFKQKINLTGSSRTDAGVHALQNFFHFDTELNITNEQLYNINAILPGDIVAKAIYPVKNDAHVRFSAMAREYHYYIYTTKNPFLADRAWFYPFAIDIDILNEAAAILMQYKDFTSFSKRNTQVNTFECSITNSQWKLENDCYVYEVRSNRFLRGMVRGLVGTMLKAGRKIITIDQFKNIIEAKDCTKADFTTPAHGLFLAAVDYREDIFIETSTIVRP